MGWGAGREFGHRCKLFEITREDIGWCWTEVVVVAEGQPCVTVVLQGWGWGDGGPKAEGEPQAMCTPFILGHKMSPTNNSVSHTEQTELKMHKTKQDISLEHNNG